MDKYSIVDGLIIDNITNTLIDSKYIFSIIDSELKNSNLGIRFSKVGVSFEIVFELNNKKIALSIYAIKGRDKYPIKCKDNKFADYIIINGVWHYLNGPFSQIIDLINNSNIDNLKQISFPKYMELVKSFITNDIEYVDNVSNDLKEIKIENNNELIGLKANLFEYQNIGYNWLSFMKKNNCGCILADEMGLGKTLQIISLFGSEFEKNSNVHFLIIAPMSLLENWRREIAKFYPSLSTLVHHGSNRTGLFNKLLQFNVVITAYTSVKRDLAMLNMIEWDGVILDEAQNIKTPSAERTKIVKLLKRKQGIAVTGTPFENHMSDIWSIVDFVFPNYLGDLNTFSQKFTDDYDSASKLETLITPIMIRRLVKDVAKDLPDRVDIPQPIEMTYQEAVLYEGERKQDINEALKKFTIDKIQKLRMFCTHPLVYDSSIGNVDPALISQKYQRLCEVVEEIVLSNEKVIIFTSFNKMIDILVKDLNSRFKVPTLYLNGEVSADDRQKTIDRFSNIVGSAIIICNPRVAGAGLNITAANHVIHYNLEWNPAVEDQASARAYRRGQNKTVFVHRFFYINTIEEVINERIQSKRILSETAVIGNNGTEEDKKDLIRALSLSPYREDEK